jgi:hypothetical protein
MAESRVWTQLNTKTVSDLVSNTVNASAAGVDTNTATSNLKTLGDAIHIEKVHRDDLEAIDLINKAILRADGGPMPATSKIVTKQWDDGGATTESVFTPGSGEVWSINAGSYSSTGGTSRIYLFLYDGTNRMEIADETCQSGQHFLLEPFNAPGFMIDENMTIQATVAVTDSTAENLYLSMIRIR